MAGKIEINLENIVTTKSSSKSIRALNELVCYLRCFLEMCVFPDNPQQVTKVICALLQTSHLNKGILSFNFPSEIREQFQLKRNYHIRLIHNDVFAFCKKLQPQYKLMCQVSIDAYGSEKKYALRRIQKLVWKSPRHLDNISITQYDEKYITVVNFRLQQCSRIETETSNLTQAIYFLQKTLLPKDERD